MRSLSRKAKKENIPETICLDFDGVCAKYDGTNINELGGPLDGFKEFCAWARGEGYKLVIQSARNDQQIRKWLKEIDEDIDVSFGKPAATWYVDDRAVWFNGNFEQLKGSIKSTQPWWKKK